MYIKDVFNSIPLNKFPTYFIDVGEALVLLYSGVPLTISNRKRILRRLTEKEYNLISEFDIIDTRKGSLYFYYFSFLLIPMDKYVIILNLVENTREKLNWDDIRIYLNFGIIRRVYISNELGKIIEDVV